MKENLDNNNEINKEIYDSLVRKTEMRDLKQCNPDNKINNIVTVSYTHLTLPTISSV